MFACCFELVAVASALTSPDTGGHRHIPYRESKLTRILQDSLGGNAFTVSLRVPYVSVCRYPDHQLVSDSDASLVCLCLTFQVMCCNVSPAAVHEQETLNALRFAER